MKFPILNIPHSPGENEIYMKVLQCKGHTSLPWGSWGMRNLYTFTTLLLGHKILNDGSRKAYYVCTHKIWLSLLHKLIRFVEYATLATKYYVAIIDTNPAHNSLLIADFSEL